jgi:uncharacterized protein YegJ (DUF2314 family)
MKARQGQVGGAPRTARPIIGEGADATAMMPRRGGMVLGYAFMLAAALLMLAAAVLWVKRMLAVRGGAAPAEGTVLEGGAGSAEDMLVTKAAEDLCASRPARVPPVSLVLLQRDAVYLTRDTLAAAIKRATGLTIAHEARGDAYWAAPPMPSIFPLMLRGNLYAVTVVQEPYTSDRDWYVDDDTPPELLSAWQKHRAWLSVDVIAAKGAADPMDFIGRLTAELTDEDTLAVVHPAARHAVAFDPEVRSMLRTCPARQVVKGPLRAFALLRRTPRKLTQGQLTAAVHGAWGRRLSEAPRDAACAVVAGESLAYVQHEGVRMGMAVAPGRYVTRFRQAAAEIDDLRVRQAFEAHTCWWGVDFVEAAVNVSKARVYQLLGCLAAEFLDEGVTMLFAPEYHRAALIDERVRRQLRGDDPLEAVFRATRPPLLQVEGDEPAMREAIAEARRRWPEFVHAFAGRKAGRHFFAIKRGFASGRDNGHQEYMWVQVTEIQEDRIVGLLDNDPVYVQGVKAGDRVMSRAAEVVDWIYKANDDLVGNFTGPVILAAQRRRR